MEIEVAANMNSENDDITAGATDGMLGPNPFVGLRAIDIFAAVQQIGAQAMLHPALLLDQTAALARDLTSVVTGNETSVPQQGDKRFADPAWRDQSLYRTTLQGYQAWRNALAGFVERSALDDASKERAQFVCRTSAAGPGRVKTRSHCELTKPGSAQVAAFSIAATRTSNHSRTDRKGSITPYGPHALIAFITASEPSSLITRFMLYASTCKLISVLTRPMVRVRK